MWKVRKNGICPTPDADTLEEQLLVHNVHPVHNVHFIKA